MLRREFQYEEGASRKFWAISVDGTKHSIQFGKIGSSGQTQVKEFPSPWSRPGCCGQTHRRKNKIPDQVLPSTLPAILVEGKALTAPHVETVLRALMVSKLESPAPLVRALREKHCAHLIER
jgi:predicted DNA-binding WGR domain protein